MSKPRVGEVFKDKYLILSELGSGGMGTVYHARQLDSDREVALKIPHIDNSVQQKEDVARFFREFKNLSKLVHSNIMTIYGIGLEDDIPFAVCEFLNGGSLRGIIRDQEGIGYERAVRIVIQIALAMEYAHELGILHRDLKPENVLLLNSPHPDFVKLIDFGLSRIFLEMSESQKITKTGAIVGSPHYLAPEQILGRAEKRSDIYSLGCILFELIAGSYLFDADSGVGIIYHHCNDDPADRLNAIADKVPETLLFVLHKALEKKPERRYQSMAAFADDLNKILNNSDEISAQSYVKKKKPVIPIFALAAVPLLAIVIAVFVQRNTQTLSKSRQDAVPPKQSSRPMRPVRSHQTAIADDANYGQLIFQGESMVDSEPRSALQYLQKGTDLAKKAGVDSTESMYKAYWSMGKAYQNIQDYQSAADSYLKAYDSCPSAISGDKLNAAGAVAFMYSYLAKRKEAVAICEKAIRAFEKAGGDEFDAGLLHANSTYVLMLAGDAKYKEAAKLALDVLRRNDKEGISRANSDSVDLTFSVYRYRNELGLPKQAASELETTRRQLITRLGASDNSKSFSAFMANVSSDQDVALAACHFAYNAAQFGMWHDAEQMGNLALAAVGDSSDPMAQTIRTMSSGVMAQVNATKSRSRSASNKGAAKLSEVRE